MIAKPTLEQFRKYQSAYDYFNRALFGGCLKPCLLVFRDGKRSKRGIVVGHFARHRWTKSGETCHEISLNPEALNRELSETMGTLVHEMAHQWQQDHGTPPRAGYHDREWAAKMVEIGLIPSTNGQPGGKQTGQSMHHYVDPNGRFAAALEKMPDSIRLPWVTGNLTLSTEKPEDEPKPKNKIKYTCTGGCGANAWGKPNLQIICGECSEPFTAA
jgi:hypothetical protein